MYPPTFWGKCPNTPKSIWQSHKKKSKVFNSLFHIKWDLTVVSRPSVGRIILVSQVLRWSIFGKLGPNTPNHVQGHTKNNPKFQLLVSHQMRHCCSVRALCGLSYSRFTGSQVVGQFGETGPEYPKPCAGAHGRVIQIFSSLFHVKWGLTLVSGPSVGRAVSQALELRQFGETGPEYPKSCARTHKK